METLDNALDIIGIETKDNTKDIINEAKESGMNISVDNKKKAEPLMYKISNADRDLAVNTCLIPKTYRDAAFNVDKIKTNLKKQYVKTNKLYRVYKFSEYVSVCEGILSCLRAKQLPSKSYLIGAPNGFGKTSFVNECLITLQKQGYRVAPYISLYELSILKNEEEKRLLKPVSYVKMSAQEAEKAKLNNDRYTYLNPYTNKGIMKSPEVITGCYSYSEYINADCLFVALSDVVSKVIESHTLKQLLTIRTMKGLPTIVTVATSMDPYESDMTLKELIWEEIKTIDENDACLDRLYYVSCYKIKNIGLNKDEMVDSDTGIVN